MTNYVHNRRLIKDPLVIDHVYDRLMSKQISFTTDHCYGRGLLSTQAVMDGSVLNVVCYKQVCFEKEENCISTLQYSSSPERPKVLNNMPG